jgi:hypothetical protein
VSDIHFEGSDFLVNTITESGQSGPEVIRTSGGFTVVYTGTIQGGTLGTPNPYAQRFTSDGTKFDREVWVASSRATFDPDVTATVDGGFVVGFSRGSNSGSIIMAEFYEATSTASSSTYATGGTAGHFVRSMDMTTLFAGNIVMTYSETLGDSSGSAVRALVLDQQGTQVKAPFTVNTVETGDQVEPSIAAFISGGFLITWTDLGAAGDGSTSSIKGQLFDAAANNVGAEFFVDSTTTGAQSLSSAAALRSGAFIVVWQDTSNSAATGTDVRGQLFDAAGNKVGGEFTVTTTVAGEQLLPVVRPTESGGFIVSWSDNSGTGGDSSGYGVKAQLFDSTGARIGGEFLLNSITTGDQNDSDVAALGDDRYVAAWTDASASPDDPSGLAVRGRIFQALRGSSGDDVIAGGADGDTIRFQDGGIDIGIGLGGNDIFYYGRTFDRLDRVDGGEGTDTLVLQGDYLPLVFDEASLVSIEGISLQSGSITRWGQSGNFRYDYNLVMANGNVAPGQQLRVNAQSLLEGEDFTFDGSAETDGGRFLIYGGHGSDNLTGGSGNDIFFFEVPRLGTDRIDGRGGNDTLVISGAVPGSSDPVRLDLVSGLFTNIESVSFNGRFASDPGARPSYEVVLYNGNAALGDRLIINASSFEASQFLKFDGSFVSDARLHIFGGAGNDTLTGGANGDLIYGGGGADRMVGNGGADIFQYRSTSDSLRASYDRIQFFERGADRIDLSLIDADTSSAGDQAFRVIGSNGFSGSAGELRVLANSDPSIEGAFVIEGDVDGDGVGDFLIAVSMFGGAEFAPSDIIL